MRSYDFGVTVFSLQDIDDPEEEDEEDEDEDDTENDDDDDDEDDEEDNEEEEETWQVSNSRPPAKGPAMLDFGRCTARLSPISQLS